MLRITHTESTEPLEATTILLEEALLMRYHATTISAVQQAGLVSRNRHYSDKEKLDSGRRERRYYSVVYVNHHDIIDI